MTTVDLAQDIVDKRAHRNSLARSPQVLGVKTHLDGPLTFVILDTDQGTVSGWAKFNANDKRVLKIRTRSGKTKTVVESKYNERAGLERALNRAAEKLVPDAKEE